AVAAIAEAAGARAFDLGIARDTYESLAEAFARARALEADVVVTIGGASVGDYDLVAKAFAREGMDLAFHRVALRPGKPLMHGRLGSARVLGLPGNPVSSIVCAILFLRPLVRALLGDPAAAVLPLEPATLGAGLRANDLRKDFLRATLARGADGGLVATALPDQDSSLVAALARADALIVREPFAPKAEAGARAEIVRLDAVGA
ncbi:MAG: molybdopterin molybdenumtransferase MoeA, partial [Hyphomicrobiales bacterium]|nr:molybdopterin molybdenumtransferase MoeA [Hyphomicrobiales bacterium]